MRPKIQINEQAYEVIDAKEYMTIPDCFVTRANKIGSGNGEAKFYVGNENKETLTFFDDFKRKCFFLKSDFMKYLEDAKLEYIRPEQNYLHRRDLPRKWNDRMWKIASIKDEIIQFSIYRVNVKPPRVYINSEDNAYSLLREITLPQISYLSALKLKSKKGEIVYYFRVFLDYYGKDNHPSIINKEVEEIELKKIKPTEKIALIKARIGQGEYREGLLMESPVCLITGVTDERLLIASHIKPWSKSTDKEKLDPKNGFTLTPTYDALFDKGFVSFENDGTMLISPWISPLNQKKLNLSPRKKYIFTLNGREEYLKYHRDEIFKK